MLNNRFVRPALLASLALSSHAMGGITEYTLDDGTGNFNIGPSQFDANMTWCNAFSAQAGGEIITHVRVSFGDIENNDGIPGPDGVTVAILDDPNNDGDPSDAVLLTTASFQWSDLPPNEFMSVGVAPVQVEGGFFVAVEMDVLERANPARMDPQGPGSGTHSWMFYNPESRLHDLGNSKYILQMSASPFQGAWMIRANARGCLGDLLIDGVTDIFDVVAFIDAFNSGNLNADYNLDGLNDIFDVLAFIEAFNAGCP